MLGHSKGSRLHSAVTCRNALCPIILLSVGIVTGITGIIVAAVGFGKRPKDMYDNANLSMRVAGLILIGLAVIPVVISIMCWVFYCSNKRAAKRGPTKENSEAFMFPMETAAGENWHNESAGGGSNIYRPGDASGNRRDQNDVIQPFGVGSPNASSSVYSEQYNTPFRGGDELVANAGLRTSDVSSKGPQNSTSGESKIGKPADDDGSIASSGSFSSS